MPDDRLENNLSILLCVDLEPGSETLVRYARCLARRCNYSVRVLHVARAGPDEAAYREAEAHLLALTRKVLSDVTVDRIEVLEGTPEDVIVRTAVERTAGLVVLGRRKRPTVERTYVGSTTSAVIALASVPVIVVPLHREEK